MVAFLMQGQEQIMRDSRIELYRCLCMFGVVLLHALDQGGYADAHRGLDNLMTPSVVGFIFISGWFGIRFKLKSAAKLIWIGLASAVMITFAYHVLWCGELNLVAFLRYVWCYTQYAWFLWMYLALMIIAPLLEPLFAENAHRGGVIRKLLPFWIMIFGWSYAATKLPGLKAITPSVIGFHPFGVLTFVGVYTVARVISREAVEKWSTWWIACAAVVSGGACWVGFMHYNSPFALIFAGSMFLLVKRIENFNSILHLISQPLKKLVLFISPSMFSVYLLHNNTAGLTWLQQAEDYLIRDCDWNYYAACFLVAGCIFIGGILLDLPRRFLSVVWCKIGAKMV